MGPKVPRMLNSWKLLGPIVLLATSSYWLTVFTLVSHNNLRNPLLRIGNSQKPRALRDFDARAPLHSHFQRNKNEANPTKRNAS